MYSEEKVRTPYPIIANVTPFGWNNFSETLLVANYQSDISLRKVWPTPQCRIISAVRCFTGFLHVQPVSPHSISVGLRSGLWLIDHSRTPHFLGLSHSLVDLLVCFGSFSCCRVQLCFSFNFFFFFTDGLRCCSSTLWHSRIHGGFYDG